MSKITLMRHGIAEDKKTDYSDLSRELTPRGRRKLLQRLEKNRDKLHNIDMIICSPAIRCRQTAALLSSFLDIDPNWIFYDERIYIFENNADELLHIIGELPIQKKHICLIGHNNSISSLASYMTKKDIHMKKGSIVYTNRE